MQTHIRPIVLPMMAISDQIIRKLTIVRRCER